MTGWASFARSPQVSVDRRLSLLILSGMGASLVVIVTAALVLGRLADERSYMDRYVFAPLVDIGQALAAADEVHQEIVAPARSGDVRGALHRLRASLMRYVRDWETGTSGAPEAARLRSQLTHAGEAALLEREHQMVAEWTRALDALERSPTLADRLDDLPLRSPDVAALDRALVELNLINLRYVQIAYRSFERVHFLVTGIFFAASAVGLVTAALFGFSVRRAIGPRVQRMVEAVRRFREDGCLPRIDGGDDDLGVLAHTLSVSFRSIAERDREREQFLAVAAHELKTPLSNLKGYAQAALVRHDDPALCARALETIDRQATRLARLSQDLLWSARAGARRLPFHPAPFDLAALARRVIAEVGVLSPVHVIHLAASYEVHVLGDAALLEQALWNLIIHAASLAPPGAPVTVSLAGTDSRACLAVEARTVHLLPDDLEVLFEPFAPLPYERREGDLRGTGLGLYLVREIARLHGAAFRLERRPGDVVAGVLELPR